MSTSVGSGTLIQQRDSTMKTIVTRIAIAALALSFVTAAHAQSGDWYIAGSIAYVDDDPDRAVADAVAGFQIHAGRDLTEHLSFEGMFGYNDWEGWTSATESFPDQQVFDLSANLLVYFNRDWNFSPYLLVGAGYLPVNLDSAGSDNNASGTFGLGFNWRMGSSGRFSLRSEARNRIAFGSDARWTGDGNLTDFLFTVGLNYSFGDGPADIPEPMADTDGDGVLDMWDECPDTASGTQVSSSGCPLLGRDDDSDNDRIPDNRDECPNTPLGAAVNPQGCSLDSDMDGVPTDRDRCPASRVGAEVDIYGCENDRDADGVVDHKDSCPSTRPNVRVDIYGCEIEDIIHLPGINFLVGQDALLPGTEYVLQDAATTLNNHPDLMIEVAGHTDDMGPGDTNFGLSERRANTVRDYLIRFGVDESRLTAVGYGESQPIADNRTAEGRATNRRVELRLLNR